MTAMADAMKKAGVNTATSGVYTVACEHLKQAGNSPQKAASAFARVLRGRSDFLLVVAQHYLTSVAADMAGKPDDRTVEKESVADPGPKPSARRLIPVREHKRRTPEQVAAEKQAWAASAAAIYDTRQVNGMPIGSIKWHELQAICHDNAMSAASYLRLGTEATENALLLNKISAYAVVSEMDRTVRDVVPAEVVARLADEARVEAPHLIETGMRLYADHVEQRHIS